MTSAADQSFERRPAAPRRVRNGVKLPAGEQEPRTWVAQQWMALLETLVPEPRRREGLEYARSGQTISLSVTPGVVEGRVQGRRARPYQTRWRMPVLADDQWQRLIEGMATEAFYAAKLLANELPPATEALLTSLDLRLLPSASEISITCDCGASSPCKHAATIGYLMARRFDDEPLIAFRLRGMEGARVLDRLAASRASQMPGAAAARAQSILGPSRREVAPLESCLDSFWRGGPDLAEMERLEPPHHAPHALLRRLGPSLLPGRFPLVGLLASIYDTVSEAAIKIRDRAEGIE